MTCKQEGRISRNEVILDTHSGMLPELAAGLANIAADLKAIKWCAIGGAVGFVAHQIGILEVLKAFIV
jgi:hypothetical protein